MEIRNIIEKIAKEKEGKGGIQNVVWVAAGGSNGGNYPAQYFMDREAKSIRSQMFTSNEFVYAPPKFVGENTIAVITSMRGTPETCVAAQVAKDLGAVTIGLYVQESLLTETCEYNIKYDSIMFDESDQSKTNAALGMRIAMDIVDVAEGYEHYADAMAAYDILDKVYNDAKEYCMPLAKKWAMQNKDEHVISVMASGPAYAAGSVSYTHLTRWTQKTFGLLTDSSISIWRMTSCSGRCCISITCAEPNTRNWAETGNWRMSG